MNVKIIARNTKRCDTRVARHAMLHERMLLSHFTEIAVEKRTHEVEAPNRRRMEEQKQKIFDFSVCINHATRKERLFAY